MSNQYISVSQKYYIIHVLGDIYTEMKDNKEDNAVKDGWSNLEMLPLHILSSSVCSKSNHRVVSDELVLSVLS